MRWCALLLAGCADVLDGGWTGDCVVPDSEPAQISMAVRHADEELTGDATIDWLGTAATGPLTGSVVGDAVELDVDTASGPFTVSGALNELGEAVFGACTTWTGAVGEASLYTQRARQ